MGNICRSPTAEGVFRHLVQQEQLEHLIETDSSGTHAYHVGEAPDHRAQATAVSRGIDLSDLRARRATTEDFETFDYILAMDNDNYDILKSISPAGFESRLKMFLSYAPELNIKEVPDPYYGGGSGFDDVFDMVEVASQGLLNEIKSKHLK